MNEHDKDVPSCNYILSWYIFMSYRVVITNIRIIYGIWCKNALVWKISSNRSMEPMMRFVLFWLCSCFWYALNVQKNRNIFVTIAIRCRSRRRGIVRRSRSVSKRIHRRCGRCGRWKEPLYLRPISRYCCVRITRWWCCCRNSRKQSSYWWRSLFRWRKWI